MSLNDFSLILAYSKKSSFRIFKSTVQGEDRQGKRVRMSSPGREESVDDTFSELHLGGPSQPHQWPQPGQEHSADSTDDERNLISYVHIMNAAEDAGSHFQGDESSLNWWPGPWSSDDRSETEYSSATEVSNSTCSPQFEEDYDSCESIRVYTREIILLTETSDENEDVDIIH